LEIRDTTKDDGFKGTREYIEKCRSEDNSRRLDRASKELIVLIAIVFSADKAFKLAVESFRAGSGCNLWEGNET